MGTVATCAVLSLVLLVFSVAMLPPTDPPSAGHAISSAFWFWIASLATLLVLVGLARTGRQRLLIVVGVCCAIALVVLAVRAGAAYEQTRLDSCLWGQGGYEQPHCIAEATELPGIRRTWLAAGTGTIAGCFLAAWVARRLFSLRPPTAT